MSDPLHLIDLDQDLPGQRRFISCWTRPHGELTYVVDPGPPATAARLISELEGLNLERLDYILLTHVHLDHGGATADLLERWPAARVVCQKVGGAHIVDPSRLWQGSLQVLGHKAEVYGEPRPVPAAALVDEAEVVARGIEIIPTPGHAPHHLAFQQDENLFLGEAAGTYSTLGKGSDTDSYYLRPATPPRFFPRVAMASLDALLALDPRPKRLCFAHHGEFTGDVAELLTRARDQLSLWVDTTAELVQQRRGVPAEQDTPALAELMDQAEAALLNVDEAFARQAELPADIRIREADFTRQTLRGILGHLASLGA